MKVFPSRRRLTLEVTLHQGATCRHIRRFTRGTGQRSASFEGAAAWLDLISKKRDKVLFFVGRCPQTHTSVFHSILGLFMFIERSESGTNRSTATADVL